MVVGGCHVENPHRQPAAATSPFRGGLLIDEAPREPLKVTKVTQFVGFLGLFCKLKEWRPRHCQNQPNRENQR